VPFDRLKRGPPVSTGKEELVSWEEKNVKEGSHARYLQGLRSGEVKRVNARGRQLSIHQRLEEVGGWKKRLDGQSLGPGGGGAKAAGFAAQIRM